MKKLIRQSFFRFVIITVIMSLSKHCWGLIPDPTPAANPENVFTNEYIANRMYGTPNVETEINFSQGYITLDQNIIFTADSGKTLRISIGKNPVNATDPVVFRPFASTPTNPNKFTHVIFEPQAGGKIVVDCYKDLIFSGNNVNDALLPVGADPLDYDSTKMVVSFRGKGTTIFNLADGRTVSFTSLIEDNANTLVPTVAPALPTDRKPLGVALQVVMDQNQNEVVTQGQNKVIVQRKDFHLTGGNNNNDCTFEIGTNSYLSFISHNYTGYDSSTDPLHQNIPTNLDGTLLQSYAAIAFDVSNRGKGRLVLNIKGDQSVYNAYTDGSFMLMGHYLQDQADDSIASPGSYTNNDHLRLYTRLNQIAGCKAFLRVIDNQMFFWDSNPVNNTGGTYVTSLNPPNQSAEVGVVDGASTRRSLLIRNSAKSIAPIASNLIGDGSWYNQEIYNNDRGSSPVQPGFVLGVNGHIDVNHNTFLEYEAASANIDFEPVNIGMNTLNSAMVNAGYPNPLNIFKQRNPSAFIIDGLGDYVVSNVNKIKFLAHKNPNIYRRAEITLYGNASLTFRAKLLGNVVGNAFIPSTGLYDGKRVAVTGETFGDGVFVLDVEGNLTLRSLEDSLITSTNTNYYGWHQGSAYDKAGVVRLGSLWRSYDDREIFDLNEMPLTSYVARPLEIPQVGQPTKNYVRYDRPSILFNSNIDLIDVSYHHEDISRNITPDVNNAPPVFLGGELVSALKLLLNIDFKSDIPSLRLYRSKIHCHESLCMSGMRIMVRELPSLLSISGNPEDNLSSIIMYNHGFLLDNQVKHYGRLFMLGSNLNLTASGLTYPQMKNSYLNIFRHTGGDATTGANPANLESTLSLETKPEVPAGVSVNEKSTQLFFMGNDSSVEVGWTSEVGIAKDNNDIPVFPWDHLLSSQVTISSNLFNIDATQEKPATLRFAGDYIYLGGLGPNGEDSPSEVNSYDLGRVIYMGHGSKIEITTDLSNPAAPRPYIGYSDATIAVKLWKSSKPGLSTQINLPKDQFFLKTPIVPYNINLLTLTDSVINNVDPSFNHVRLTKIASGVGTAFVNWSNISRVPGSGIGRDHQYLSVLSTESRFANSIVSPITLPPRGLLYVTENDNIDTLVVSGATIDNKFDFYITGAKTKGGGGRVKEFASGTSTSFIAGEGSFANLVIDSGGRIGLGSRNAGPHSLTSWNVIGRNSVTIVPNGDGQVDLNNNVVVGDSQPIIPTTGFGSKYIDTNSNVVVPTHKLTFYSHEQKEIRIPTGGELDLSAFGQADTTGTATQQISIGGQVRLVFEPGSTLRFPDLTGANVDKQPILYLNENSEIIFESVQDMDNKFVNSATYSRWTNIRDSDRARTRILGVGQIWINKTSKMSINDGAIVAIEADQITPHTNITISLQREGLLELGNANVLGGSLQVGTPAFNADGSPFTIVTSSPVAPEINFSLRLNSENCKVHMGRNSFMGFGVGVVDRFEQVLNGRWRIQGLKYVKNINLRMINGVFSHNQIYDGGTTEGREASVLAVGPVSGKYKIEFSKGNAFLLGGGNIVYLTAPSSLTDIYTLDIRDTAAALVDGGSTDSGKYSLVNSSAILKLINRTNSLIAKDPTSTISFLNNDSNTPVVIPTGKDVFSESLLNSGYGFSGSARDFYTYLAAKDFKNQVQSQTGYVMLGKNFFERRIGYVLAGKIYRSTNLSLENGITTSDVDMVKIGVLLSATINSQTGAPEKNKLPEQ